MFKIYDEPESPSKGGVFKICDEDERNRQMSGRVWGGGGGGTPQSPLFEAVQGC